MYLVFILLIPLINATTIKAIGKNNFQTYNTSKIILAFSSPHLFLLEYTFVLMKTQNSITISLHKNHYLYSCSLTNTYINICHKNQAILIYVTIHPIRIHYLQKNDSFQPNERNFMNKSKIFIPHQQNRTSSIFVYS